MRTLLTVTIDVEAGNRATADGSLGKIIKSTMDQIKPECAYFVANEGSRSCMMVFDMKDASEIPVIAEPLFIQLKAKVEFSPVMNAEELEKGLKAYANL